MMLSLLVLNSFKLSEVFGNKFLKFFAVAVAVFISLRLLLWIISKFWKKKAYLSELTAFIDKVLKVHLPVAGIFLSIDIGIGMLEAPSRVLITLSRLCETAVVIIFYYLSDKTSLLFIKQLKERFSGQPAWDFMPLLQKTVRTLIFITALIFVLSVWNVEVGPILTGLGIAGLAVSLALQNTLANIFAGISLVSDRTYTVGDYIDIGDGTVGMVEHIGLRSTKIITWDNEVVIIPNRVLAESRVKNFSRPQKLLRLTVDFSVVYGVKPDEVQDVVMNAISGISEVLKSPSPQLILTKMGDYGLEFRLFVWITSVEQKYETLDKVNREIYKSLVENGIGIPYPTHTVYIEKGG